MTLPAVSSTTSGKLSRNALARLFWQSKVMPVMRTGEHVVRCHYIPSDRFSGLLWGEGPPQPLKVSNDDLITFILWTFRIDQEPWAAIVCDGRTIIPPFPFFGYDQLPLRPESIPRV